MGVRNERGRGTWTFTIVAAVVGGLFVLAWNGLVAYLTSIPRLGEAIAMVSPVINTFIITAGVMLVAFSVYRKCMLDRIALLEDRLSNYENADTQLQLRADIVDYRNNAG